MNKIHMTSFLLYQLPITWILFWIQAKYHEKLKTKITNKFLLYLLSGIILFYLTGIYIKFNQHILLPMVPIVYAQ